MSETGFLVCADITGYTLYLSKSELEEASGILGSLLNLLLGEIQAPLHLSRVEGDAVISYSQAIHGVDPQLLVDRLEATYVAFRRALEQMVLNTSCRCNACANISTLDLKFVVHYGPFVVQHLGIQDELMGPEVNAMFRLVKNRVRQELGIPGYIAFTDVAVAALGLPGYAATLIEHVEDDPERGPVALHVRDMGQVWERRRHERVVELPEVMLERSEVIAAPIETVWSYLTHPETRATLMAADKMNSEPLDDGRIGREAVYVCFHGDTQIRHTVLDWDPPYRYVFESRLPVGLSVLGEFRSASVDDAATRVEIRIGGLTGPKLKMLRMRSKVKTELEEWAEMVAGNLTAMADPNLAGAT